MPRPPSDRDDFDDEDREDRPRRRRRELPSKPTSKMWLLPVLLVCAAGFLFLCCAGSIVAYFVFGVKTTTDPVEVQNAIASITDVQLPNELNPEKKSVQITGVVTITFRSGSGRSFVQFVTGPLFDLRHQRTLRDARDSGKATAGGHPEQPLEERTIPLIIRGRPAQFIYRRYTDTETVSGYFLGKQYPVHMEAELSLREFAAGTADALIRSIH